MSETTQSGLIERNAVAVCHRVLDDAPDGVLGVGLSADVIDGFLTATRERDDPPLIRILAAESVLKNHLGDFTDASTTADLVARDVLTLKTTTARLDGSLLVTDDEVVSVVSTGSLVAGLTIDDDEFVESARSQYADQWDNAEAFKLRTPPLTRIQNTLDDEFGPDLRTDFDSMRTALDTRRGSGELDEVDICLLAAAKNEALLYDISTWGENIGVASRATFSRKKSRLEERGLIETHKVPIDVGRPRQRLVLGDDRLHGTDADELVSVAGSLLSTVRS